MLLPGLCTFRVFQDPSASCRGPASPFQGVFFNKGRLVVHYPVHYLTILCIRPARCGCGGGRGPWGPPGRALSGRQQRLRHCLLEAAGGGRRELHPGILCGQVSRSLAYRGVACKCTSESLVSVQVSRSLA